MLIKKVGKIRQPCIREMPSTACKGCEYFVEACCQVPGGTCIKREIAGVPGHYVGDILANVGIIDRTWWEAVLVNIKTKKNTIELNLEDANDEDS